MPRRAEQRRHAGGGGELRQARRLSEALVDPQRLGLARHLAHVAELEIEIQQQRLESPTLGEQRRQNRDGALPRTSASADDGQQQRVGLRPLPHRESSGLADRGRRRDGRGGWRREEL